MSKTKLSKIYPDLGPNCDKCSNPDATLIHMFWLCPSLEMFWREVFQTLCEILNYTAELNPLIVLFVLLKRSSCPGPNQIHYLLLPFWPDVLLKWKGTTLPTHSQWLKDLFSCLTLEKIRHSLHGSEKKLYKVLGSFLDYLQIENLVDSTIVRLPYHFCP